MLDESGPCPMSRGIDKLSLTTRTSVRVLEVSTSGPRLLTIRSEGLQGRSVILDNSRLGQTSRDVDQLSQMIHDRVQGPVGLTSCPGDSCPGPSAHAVDQQSWENRASAGGHTVSTSSPGRLVPCSQCPWGRPALLGDSRSGPSPGIRAAVPDDSGPCPRSCGVDPLPRPTPARVQGFTSSTRYPE